MAKGRFAEDLSGRKYGNLTVVRQEESRKYDNGRVMAMFLCRCDCGVEKVISATRLRTGKVTSCGCMSPKPLRSCYLEDLTGKKFGRWTVLYRAESYVEPSGRKVTMWHCRCDCGAERDIRAGTLKSGSSQSCGCLKRDVLTVNRNLVGERYGRWTVLGPGVPYVSPDGRSFRTWQCRCDCGTEHVVSELSLVAGRSVSCGCYRVECLRESCYNDFTGKTFGELTAVKRLPDRHTFNGHRVQEWLCRCSCGKEVVCRRSGLAMGVCVSCGHDRCTSSIEAHVREYLENNLYSYEPQKRYPKLVGVGGHPLSYDFLVFKDNSPYCLIECQGRQHYEPIEYFGGDRQFQTQLEHDRRKREYAKENDVPLVEVPYLYGTYEAVASFLDDTM